MLIAVESYAAGAWHAPGDGAAEVLSPVSGQVQARVGTGLPADPDAMLAAAARGGAALREMGLHDRARLVKALARRLDAEKERLYALSTRTGATRRDSWIDIDGGIGTCFVFASKARREMPDGPVHLDGGVERLSRGGSFLGRHVCVPKAGVAVQVNAFNFPVWGMLEKLAPALIAGVPSIVKPAAVTSYLTAACVRLIVESGLLPEGALQMITGRPGPLLDRLGPQDSLAFTGSAATARALRGRAAFLDRGAAFLAEQDSLNAMILGPDAAPGTPEFDLFLSEAAAEMTTKAGQKCTAARRLIVPEGCVDAMADALRERLGRTVVGDPADAATQMGPLVSAAQRVEVEETIRLLSTEARPVRLALLPVAWGSGGAFIGPTLMICDDPDAARAVHETEAFGPVATILPARDTDHAVALACRGGGSLVASLFTHDPDVARAVALGLAPWHGRVYLNDRDSAAEATGHGSPLAHMTHGGPGRAGGGEELGGIRAVLHHMARVAVQGSPRHLAAIGGEWIEGAPRRDPGCHPFRLRYEALRPGDSFRSPRRTVTMEDIETFAAFTGDTFYAHLDEAAAAANPFFPGRVAHGYLLLSFAAGLFVDPAPGPVLANTGLLDLAFEKPVVPGTEIDATLTVARKTRRTDAYGEVRWHVRIADGDDETVARYTLLTMVAREGA